MKGGKAVAGAAAADTASMACAAALAEYATSPESFVVFTLVENVGVPKKGVSDYLMKIMRADGKGFAVDAIVPRPLLTKSSKLAIPSMGAVGTKLLIKMKTVKRERMTWCPNGRSGGVEMMQSVIETDYIVSAILA